MNDGTTATTLAPSEDEMQHFAETFTQMFASMRDKVLEASKLAQDVGELRKAVGDLRTEVDHLREQNKWLDEQLTTVRGQRDLANERAQVAERELRSLRIEAEGSLANITRLNAEVTRANEQRAEAISQWDDAELRVMSLEDENSALRAKLASIEAVFAKPASLSPEQKVEPQPRAETGQFLPKRGEVGFQEPEPAQEVKSEAPRYEDQQRTWDDEPKSGTGW